MTREELGKLAKTLSNSDFIQLEKIIEQRNTLKQIFAGWSVTVEDIKAKMDETYVDEKTISEDLEAICGKPELKIQNGKWQAIFSVPKYVPPVRWWLPEERKTSCPE